MRNQHSMPICPKAVASTILSYKLLLIIPVVLCTGAAIAYALVTPKKWSASQSIVIRDEVFKDDLRTARFNGGNELTIAQETIQQIARSHAVIEAALKEIGPDGIRVFAKWPTVKDVEATQQAVSVSAPNGAEFGKTEVLVISATAKSQPRALALTKAIVSHLDKQLQSVRDMRSHGLVQVLTKNVELAEVEVQASTKRLTAIEQSVGENIAELRGLSQDTGGSSAIQTSLTTLTDELRSWEVQYQSDEYLLNTIRAIQADPNRLLTTPSDVLQAQPALTKMQDGLIDAQLRTSTLLGEMNADHPRVQGALFAEQTIRSNLKRELATASNAVQSAMNVKTLRVESLQKRLANLKQRLAGLSDIRASYVTVVEEVRHREEILRRARQNLADATANAAATDVASVITQIDTARVGDSPVGLGRTTTVLGGVAGGLAIGLGLLFLVVPASALQEQRPAPTSATTSGTGFYHERETRPVVQSPATSANVMGGLRGALVKTGPYN